MDDLLSRKTCFRLCIGVDTDALWSYMSLLYRSSDEPGSDVALGKHKGQNNRHCRYHRYRHQVIPTRSILTNEVIKAQCERTLGIIGDQSEWEEEVIPTHQKGENGYRQHARS